MSRHLLAAVPLLLAAIVAACGSGNGDGQATTPESVTAAISPTRDPSPTPEPTPTATPSPTPGASPTNPWPAALADLDGVAGADCNLPANLERPCVTLTSNDETVRNGLAAFTVAARVGGGFVAVYGRTQAGEWWPLVRTQNSFLLLFLPGDVRVCADGDGLNVRELPTISATVVQTIADETIARVDQFVLDTAGDGERRGFGWYHLAAPVEGWAHSDFLAAAALGDCSLRNAQVTPVAAPTATASPAAD